MSDKKDVRWMQRFNNYKKALSNLSEAVELASQRELSRLEKQGLIQSFEYTYELSWKTIKDFFESKGEVEILGSKDAFRLAFNRGLVTMGEVLMETVESRKQTTHTYNEDVANEIYHDIIDKYYSAFKELEKIFDREKMKEI